MIRLLTRPLKMRLWDVWKSAQMLKLLKTFHWALLEIIPLVQVIKLGVSEEISATSGKLQKQKNSSGLLFLSCFFLVDKRREFFSFQIVQQCVFADKTFDIFLLQADDYQIFVIISRAHFFQFAVYFIQISFC